jgi:hypothetical protein
MRAILLAMLTAVGIGLAATPGAYAAPASGAVIGEAADATTVTEQVWHRRHHRRHWRPAIVCRHQYWSSYRRCWRRW